MEQTALPSRLLDNRTGEKKPRELLKGTALSKLQNTKYGGTRMARLRVIPA